MDKQPEFWHFEWLTDEPDAIEVARPVVDAPPDDHEDFLALRDYGMAGVRRQRGQDAHISPDVAPRRVNGQRAPSDTQAAMNVILGHLRRGWCTDEQLREACLFRGLQFTLPVIQARRRDLRKEGFVILSRKVAKRHEYRLG